MFGKKKEELPDFTLLALTTETVIDGTAHGNIDLYFDLAVPYQLTSARLRAARPGGAPDHTVASYQLMGQQVVAFVPQMDYTLMALNGLWKQYKKAFAGVFQFGPYLLEGKVMCIIDHMEKASPMLDVRITPAVTGVNWGKIEAPFALVNTFYLLGWEPIA